jgi:hypothetical protein
MRRIVGRSRSYSAVADGIAGPIAYLESGY